MGQAAPIRVRKLLRIEHDDADDIVMTWEATDDQVVIVIDRPAFQDAAMMQGVFIRSQ